MVVLAGIPPIAGDPGAGWITVADLACEVDLDTTVDLDQVADATAELMFRWSGEQFGSSTDSYRPYRAAGTCGCGSSGSWVTFSWSSMPRWVCGCNGPSYLELPGPVTAVVEVLVDGAALVDGDDYRLVDGRFLVRVGASWPCCQDLTKPSTEEGTWLVTVTHGPGIPAGGKVSARLVAIELAKAAIGADCAFSGRVQSVTRDGVSAVIITDPSFITEGRSGIPFVDMWLASLGNLRGGTITLPGPLRGLLAE